MEVPTIIYVLELAEGKVYVGKTLDFSTRMKEHISGTGSNWTSLFPPIRVVEVSLQHHPFDEDNKVKEYIFKHGIFNVRGGSYSQVNLNNSQIRSIIAELRTASDVCFTCGQSSHFASSCPYTKRNLDAPNRDSLAVIPPEALLQEEPITYMDGGPVVKPKKVKGPICSRCGRNTHLVSNCVAKKHLRGHFLPPKSVVDNIESTATPMV
ncbi:hypothetical protein RCL1_001643 [Eukaryota sp. TZLM3-RCL]